MPGAHKKADCFFCRTLIRHPSSKQSALSLIHKKADRFSTCTLDWSSIQFSSIMWINCFDVGSNLLVPQNAQMHLQNSNTDFWPQKRRNPCKYEGFCGYIFFAQLFGLKALILFDKMHPLLIRRVHFCFVGKLSFLFDDAVEIALDGLWLSIIFHVHYSIKAQYCQVFYSAHIMRTNLHEPAFHHSYKCFCLPNGWDGL